MRAGCSDDSTAAKIDTIRKGLHKDGARKQAQRSGDDKRNRSRVGGTVTTEGEQISIMGCVQT